MSLFRQWRDWRWRQIRRAYAAEINREINSEIERFKGQLSGDDWPKNFPEELQSLMRRRL